VSPEDVTYRRVQQSLSNLGNAINGQTPEAQFASLSGAQGGAAPFNPGNVAEPSVNQNAGLQGMQNAADIYSGNVNWQASQANPWTVGLSTLSNTAGALSSMGPFSTGYNPQLAGGNVGWADAGGGTAAGLGLGLTPGGAAAPVGAVEGVDTAG
jgi:hypothetical protein